MNSFLQFLAHLCVWVFLVGVLGSMVVVVLSFIEDLELLVDSDDEHSVDAATARA